MTQRLGDSCGFLLAPRHQHRTPGLGFAASGGLRLRWGFGLLQRGRDAWQLPLLPTARRAPCRRGVDSIAVASETVCGPVELSSRPRSAPIFLALLEPPQRSLSHRGNSSRANHGGKMTQRLALVLRVPCRLHLIIGSPLRL